MPGGDEIRDVQRAAWAGLSAGWEKWDSVIMDQLGPVGAAMIARLGIADDQQHLDIAAGTGEPGLTVARLAPKGHVVLTDPAGHSRRQLAANSALPVQTTVTMVAVGAVVRVTNESWRVKERLPPIEGPRR